MRGTRVQYRDSPYGEWKPSYAGHDYTTTEWFNRGCDVQLQARSGIPPRPCIIVGLSRV